MGLLSFRDASRGRQTCKAFNEAVLKLQYVDVSECRSLLQTQLMLLKRAGTSAKLKVPFIRFLEDFPLRGFTNIHLSGLGIPFENMLTVLPMAQIVGSNLSHLTITNAAFVKTVSVPNGTVEDYFCFDVSALAYACSLQSLYIHFDRIVQAISRYDVNCGGWLSGMEYCFARDVRIVIESPPFASLYNDLPPYGTGGGLRDRMAFRVRIPSKVHHLYIVTDCVLWLSRPAGSKYPGSPYSGRDICEDDPTEIFNMCLLSVRRPGVDIPNTQIRRLQPKASARLQSPLICVTSRSTPDFIYADNLSRHAPGHCDLTTAEEIAHDSWDDE